MPMLNNYPPGVSGNEPQVGGGPDFYLKCSRCGEVFEDIDSASFHALDGVMEEIGCDNTWEIVPEGEAI